MSWHSLCDQKHKMQPLLSVVILRINEYFYIFLTPHLGYHRYEGKNLLPSDPLYSSDCFRLSSTIRSTLRITRAWVS